jgi:hypothetical protein
MPCGRFTSASEYPIAPPSGPIFDLRRNEEAVEDKLQAAHVSREARGIRTALGRNSDAEVIALCMATWKQPVAIAKSCTAAVSLSAVKDRAAG